MWEEKANERTKTSKSDCQCRRRVVNELFSYFSIYSLNYNNFQLNLLLSNSKWANESTRSLSNRSPPRVVWDSALLLSLDHSWSPARSQSMEINFASLWISHHDDDYSLNAGNVQMRKVILPWIQVKRCGDLVQFTTIIIIWMSLLPLLLRITNRRQAPFRRHHRQTTN